MKVGVINIPARLNDRPDPSHWERCWTLTADRADLFGVNESFTSSQRDTYLRLAKERGYGQFGTRITPNPVFWDRDHWRKVSGRVHELHTSLSRFREWPGFNEARYVTEVVLRQRGSKREVTVLCTHWVPEGPKVTDADRDRARRASKSQVADLVRKHTAAGNDVLLIGDTNIHGTFSLGVPGFTWIKSLGVDKVGIAVPLDRAVAHSSVREFAAPTDHRFGVAAAIRVRAKATAS
jgi:hypothetical protein